MRGDAARILRGPALSRGAASRTPGHEPTPWLPAGPGEDDARQVPPNVRGTIPKTDDRYLSSFVAMSQLGHTDVVCPAVSPPVNHLQVRPDLAESPRKASWRSRPFLLHGSTCGSRCSHSVRRRSS